MKKLKYNPVRYDDESSVYREDVNRIVKAFANAGYELSPQDADSAWREYSDMLAAGWLILPEDDQEIVDNLMTFMTEVG